jgi:hypothetical protein
MSNEKKSATLGMPHGTAMHRLRKILLFSLLKKLNDNVCFKCSEVIEKVEDLSVEHKKPWEGVSAELFWDIENVAFSHLHCNRPDRQFRKYTPEEAIVVQRERTAKYMRDTYSTEARQLKYQRTGY